MGSSSLLRALVMCRPDLMLFICSATCEERRPRKREEVRGGEGRGEGREGAPSSSSLQQEHAAVAGSPPPPLECRESHGLETPPPLPLPPRALAPP